MMRSDGIRHREERSDVAIQSRETLRVPLDCFAALAMTAAARFKGGEG